MSQVDVLDVGGLLPLVLVVVLEVLLPNLCLSLVQLLVLDSATPDVAQTQYLFSSI